MTTPAKLAFSMRELLERAGFRLRGRNRADCIHCSGHAVATVGFSDEVMHCFRCGAKANIFTLAKQLGLLAADPESIRRWQEEARQREARQRIIRRFDAWREAHITKYCEELRRLGRSAAIATDVLALYPDCEPAWDAFARYCHREGELQRALAFLTCAKVSPWLEKNYTISEVFDFWRGVDAQR